MKITEFVLDRNNVTNFKRYRAGKFYYEVKNTVSGKVFEFPVAIEDIQEATFSASERAITMMRYIRKAMDDKRSFTSERRHESLGYAIVAIKCRTYLIQ